MRKLNLIVISLLLMTLPFNSFSQGNFTINIMGSLPVSDYGSVNMIDQDNDGAGLGFGLGFQYIYPLTHFGLGVFAGVDAIYNGYKKSVKDDLEDFYMQQTGASSDDIKWPKFLNFPLSAGLNYTYSLNENFALFVNTGLTYNFLKLTNLEIETDIGKYSKEIDLASAFGFKIGGGLVLNKKTSISINYLGLGNHNLNGDMKAFGDSEVFDGEQKIDIVTLAIGYRF